VVFDVIILGSIAFESTTLNQYAAENVEPALLAVVVTKGQGR